jgi:solute carrier family 45 protein 3
VLLIFLVGIGPVLGLISVPLLGSASDQWRGRYGRRRPFIWALSLGVLLSLFLIPRAGWLAGLLCPNARPLELALLILGVGLLDFCGQVCFTPLEALLSDLFRDPDHCRQAFSVYAFMISLGGCLGYLLPAIDWDASALAPYLGTQEECLFGLLTLIFLTCMVATLFVVEEAVLGPPEPVEGLSATSVSHPCCPCRARLAFRNLGTLFPRLHQLCCRMPHALRRLFVAELCSWMALMTFTLFYTDFVGEGLYQGVPRAEPGTDARRHYDEGKPSTASGSCCGSCPPVDVPGLGDAHSLGPNFPVRKGKGSLAACGSLRELNSYPCSPGRASGCSEVS